MVDDVEGDSRDCQARHDAFNRGDAEAFAAYATEDVELFAALAGAVEGGSFHGRAGIETYFQITAETWGEFRILAEDFRDLGDRVLVVGRIWGRGKGSRVPVEAPNAIVMDFRGEEVWRIHSYFDQAEALDDVALKAMSRKNEEVVLRWLLAFGGASADDTNTPALWSASVRRAQGVDIDARIDTALAETHVRH